MLRAVQQRRSSVWNISNVGFETQPASPKALNTSSRRNGDRHRVLSVSIDRYFIIIRPSRIALVASSTKPRLLFNPSTVCRSRRRPSFQLEVATGAVFVSIVARTSGTNKSQARPVPKLGPFEIDQKSAA